MSDTDPNAYRVEAQEKIAEAARLTAEAEVLEAKANELEGVEPTPVKQEAEVPAEDKSEEDKPKERKLFNK